jgi:CBS domain-containing protein
MNCPDCGHANFGGVDTCDHCGQPMTGQAPAASAKGRLGRTLLETTLGELDPAPALIVGADDPVLRVISRMRSAKVGSALVVEGDRLVGIFTERHIVTKLTGRSRREVEGMRVGEVMSREPKALRDDDTLAFALHRMAHDNARHVPIDHPGRPLRFVSVRRVLAFLDQHSR